MKSKQIAEKWQKREQDIIQRTKELNIERSEDNCELLAGAIIASIGCSREVVKLLTLYMTEEYLENEDKFLLDWHNISNNQSFSRMLETEDLEWWEFDDDEQTEEETEEESG